MTRRIGKKDTRKPVFKFLVLLLSVIVLAMPIIIWEAMDRYEIRQCIHNVFDEMAANNCEGLRKSKKVMVRNGDSRLSYVAIESENLPDNIKSSVWPADGTDELGMGSFVCFEFEITEDDYEGRIVFSYNSSLDTLYIYSDSSIPIKDRETYRDYLLSEVIIGEWLKNGNSRYTEEYLGEFEIADYLMPYEYCGMVGNGPKEEETVEHKGSAEQYYVWLDNAELLCIQQTSGAEWDGTRVSRIEKESYGLDVMSTQFFVQRKTDGSRCEFSDIVDTGPDFLDWLKSSGKVSGNLKKISADREAGEQSTLEMLAGCPAEEMAAVLEGCEFYMEPGYLHFKFPYWNGEKEEPGWERNGNGLWRNWLTVETEDIGEFLEVDRW